MLSTLIVTSEGKIFFGFMLFDLYSKDILKYESLPPPPPGRTQEQNLPYKPHAASALLERERECVCVNRFERKEEREKKEKKKKKMIDHIRARWKMKEGYLHILT